MSTNYKVEDYNYKERLEVLNLVFPEDLSFFPENFETANTKDDFVFTESIVDLNKLFRQEKISANIFGEDTELYRCRKDADIYLPTIFFSLSILLENPHIISVSLNILSNYVYDRLKGGTEKKNTRIEFLIEKEKGKITKISYEGDIEGLKGLEKVIKASK
ncbi:MAG TPA: hypothetical protein DEA97_14270 [Bacteroidales bacterium]|nr:MAG: hypothetical protein UR43_C0011G0021 [candidate division TM6 bacterium GW2011_GWF2_33_332]HBS87724.1 hypothetical protein [Bacteroidales bacterium]